MQPPNGGWRAALLMLAVVLLGDTCVAQRTTGINATTAFSISSLPYVSPIIRTNGGDEGAFSNAYSGAACLDSATEAPAQDAWFAFRAPSTGQLQIDIFSPALSELAVTIPLAELLADKVQLTVLNASLDSIICAPTRGLLTSATPLAQVSVTAGAVYYFVVEWVPSLASSSADYFMLSVQAPQQGTSVSSPVVLPAQLPYAISTSNGPLPEVTPTQPTCWEQTATAPVKYFSYTPAATGAVYIHLCDSAARTIDGYTSYLEIAQGPGFNLSESLACAAHGCDSTASFAGLPMLELTLQGGVTYVLAVHALTPYTLTVQGPIQGDAESDPLVPRSLPYTYAGSFGAIGVANSETVSSECTPALRGGADGKDIIISYVAPADQRLIIDVLSNAAFIAPTELLQAFEVTIPTAENNSSRKFLGCVLGGTQGQAQGLSEPALEVPVTRGGSYLFVYDWSGLSIGGDYVVTIRDSAVGTADTPVVVDALPFGYASSGRFAPQLIEFYREGVCSAATNDTMVFELGELSPPACPRGAYCDTPLAVSTCEIPGSNQGLTMLVDKVLTYHFEGGDGTPVVCAPGCSSTGDGYGSLSLPYDKGLRVIVHSDGPFKLNAEVTLAGDCQCKPVVITSLPMSDRRSSTGYSYSRSRLGELGCAGRDKAGELGPDVFYEFSHSLASRVAVDLYSADGPGTTFAEIINQDDRQLNSDCVSANGAARVYSVADNVLQFEGEGSGTQHNLLVKWPPGINATFHYTLTIKDADLGDALDRAISLSSFTSSVAANWNLVHVYESSTTGMANSFRPPTACVANAINHTAPDMVFRVALPCPGSPCPSTRLLVTVCGDGASPLISPTARVSLYLMSATGVPLSSPGSCSAGSCAGSGDSGTPALNVTLTGGLDYFLVVDGVTSESFPFTLRIEHPALPGESASSPLVISPPLPYTFAGEPQDMVWFGDSGPISDACFEASSSDNYDKDIAFSYTAATNQQVIIDAFSSTSDEPTSVLQVFEQKPSPRGNGAFLLSFLNCSAGMSGTNNFGFFPVVELPVTAGNMYSLSYDWASSLASRGEFVITVRDASMGTPASPVAVESLPFKYRSSTRGAADVSDAFVSSCRDSVQGLAPFVFKLGKLSQPAGTTACPLNAHCSADLFLSTCEDTTATATSTVVQEVIPTPPARYIEYIVDPIPSSVPTQLVGCTLACTLQGDSASYSGTYLTRGEGEVVVVLYSDGPFVFNARGYLPGDDAGYPIALSALPLSDHRSSLGYSRWGDVLVEGCVPDDVRNATNDVFYDVSVFEWPQVLVDLYSADGPDLLLAEVYDADNPDGSSCLVSNVGASMYQPVPSEEGSSTLIQLSIAVKWAANVSTPFSYTLTVKEPSAGRGVGGAVDLTQQAGSLAANGNLVQVYLSSTAGLNNSSTPPPSCGLPTSANHTAPDMFFKVIVPCLEGSSCGQARVLASVCGSSSQPLISPSARVALYTLDSNGASVPGAGSCSVGSCGRVGVAPPALNVTMPRGTPFYIVVDGAEAHSFPFSLRVEYPGAPGDSIASPLAIPSTSLPFTYKGDSEDIQFHNSEPVSSSCTEDVYDDLYAKDIVFSFTSPVSGRVILDATHLGQNIDALQVFREIPATPGGSITNTTRQLMSCDSGPLGEPAALAVPVTAGGKYVFVYDWAIPSFGGDYTLTLRDASLGTLDRPVVIDVLPFGYETSAALAENVTGRVRSSCGSTTIDGYGFFAFKLGHLEPACPHGATCEPILSLSTCTSDQFSFRGPQHFLEYNSQGERFVSDDPSDTSRPLRFSNCTNGCRFDDVTGRTVGDSLAYKENATIGLYASGHFEFHADLQPQGDDPLHPITVALLPMSDYRSTAGYAFSRFQVGSIGCDALAPRGPDMFYSIDHSLAPRVAVDIYSADVQSSFVIIAELVNANDFEGDSRCLGVNGGASVFTAADAVQDLNNEVVFHSLLKTMVKWNPDAIRDEAADLTFTLTVKDLDAGTNTTTAISLANFTASVAPGTGNLVYTYESSTVGMPNSASPPTQCGATAITDHAAGNMFFRIMIPCPTVGACGNSSLIATICGDEGNVSRISPLDSAVIYLLDSTGAPLATVGTCSVGSCLNPEALPPAIDVMLDRGVEYYIVVDGEFSDEFPFSLRLEFPDPNAVPTGPVETVVISPLEPLDFVLDNKTMRGYWSKQRSTPFTVAFESIMEANCSSDVIQASQPDARRAPKVEGFRMIRQAPFTEYAFNITAETDGTVTYFVKGGGCQDINGRVNKASKEIRYGVDSTPPSVTLRSEVGDRSNNALLLFNVVVDEPVFGLENALLTVTYGNITSIMPSPEGNGSTLVVVAPEPGNHFVTLRFDGTVMDLAGNLNTINTTARIDYFADSQDVVDAVAAGSAVVATTITTTAVAVMGAAVAGSTSLGVASPSVAAFSSGLTIMIGHIQMVQQLNGLGAPLGATFRQLTHEMNWVNFRVTPPWRWGDVNHDKKPNVTEAHGPRRRLLALAAEGDRLITGWAGSASLLPSSDGIFTHDVSVQAVKLASGNNLTASQTHEKHDDEEDHEAPMLAAATDFPLIDTVTVVGPGASSRRGEDRSGQGRPLHRAATSLPYDPHALVGILRGPHDGPQPHQQQQGRQQGQPIGLRHDPQPQQQRQGLHQPQGQGQGKSQGYQQQERRRRLMNLDDPGNAVDEVIDYKFKLVSTLSSTGRENVLGDYVDNQLQDFGSDRWEDFAVVIFWYSLLLVAVGGAHLGLQFAWERLLKRGELYSLMQFPRFEIFLLMLGLPGVSRACASLIRHRSTGEVLLGLAVLLVYPVTFLCFAGYFVFRKLLGGQHVKFVAESEPAPRGMGRQRDTLVRLWTGTVKTVVGPRRAAEWMVINQELASKKGDFVSKYGLFFEDLAGATHYARPLGGGAATASVRDVDANGGLDVVDNNARGPGAQMLPIRGSPANSGQTGLDAASSGTVTSTTRDGAAASTRDRGLASSRDGGVTSSRGAGVWAMSANERGAVSGRDGSNGVNSATPSRGSLNGNGGAPTISMRSLNSPGVPDDGHARDDVAMVEIDLNDDGCSDADKDNAGGGGAHKVASHDGDGGQGDGGENKERSAVAATNGTGVRITATDGEAHSPVGADTVAHGDLGIESPAAGRSTTTINVLADATGVGGGAAGSGRVGSGGGAGPATLDAPAGAQSLRPRLDVRYSKGRTAQLHLVRIRGIAVTVAHCRASYMFLVLCKQFLFAVMLGAYGGQDAWSQIITLTVWLILHTGWVFTFKPFVDRVLQFVESSSILMELATLGCSLGLLVNDARDASETTRHRLSTAMIVLAFSSVGVNVLNQWYDVVIMIKEFGPIIRRKLFERRFRRPQDNAMFNAEQEPGCC